MTIKQLFSPERDPSRQLNEVINTEEQIDIRSEIDEYVFTSVTKEYLKTLVDGILDTSQGQMPDCLRGWISGFFGSGKSHFLKLAAALLENRRLTLADGSGVGALEYAAEKHQLALPWQRLAKDFKVRSVTVNLAMAHGGGKLAQERPLLYRLASELNRAAGHASVPHIAQIEREIQRKKKWEAFLDEVRRHNAETGNLGKKSEPLEWQDERIRDKAYEAHLVLESVLPKVLPHVTNARGYLQDLEAVQPEPDSVVDLALALAKSLHTDMGRVLLCVDEVALYLRGASGFDGNRIREIQGLAERVKDKGRGKVFLFATAQLKVDTIDASFAGLSEYVVFLRDRFPKGGRLELEERDIDTVVRERWLKKDDTAKPFKALEKLVKDNGGLLAGATKLRDENILRDAPPLTDEKAVLAYYPCLPYHIRLLQGILQALRGDRQIDQTAAQSRALLSSIRSLFLKENGADLAEAAVGDLVTFDKVYDVIRDVVRRADAETDGRIVGSIEALDATGSVKPSSVAKVIFLLQHLNPKGTRRIRVSAENVASLLYPSLGAGWDAHLKDVRDACALLESQHFIGQELETGYRFYREEEMSFQKLVDSQVIDEAKLRKVLEEALLEQAGEMGLVSVSVKPGHKLDVAALLHFGKESLPDPEAVAKGLELHFLWPKAGAPAPSTKLLAAQYADAAHIALWLLPGVAEAEDAARRMMKLEAAIAEYTNRHGHQAAVLLKGEQAKANTLREETLVQALRAAVDGGTAIHRGVDSVLAGSGKHSKDVFDDTMAEALAVVFPHLEDGSVSMDDAALRRVFLWKAGQTQPDFMSELKLFDANGTALVDRPFLKEVELALKQRPQENLRTGKVLLEHFGRPPFGWPERVVKAGLGALLRARRVVVKLADNGVLRAETDPKAESWLTGTQQFNKSVIEPSTVTLTVEERVLLTKLFAQVLGRPALDTVEKLEGQGPAIVKEQLALAKEALADLKGRQLPGAQEVERFVAWLQPATEPELVAGQLKQLAVGAKEAVAKDQDPVQALGAQADVVGAVMLARKQKLLERLAAAATRARGLYPTWKSLGGGGEVATDLDALVLQVAGTELLSKSQKALDRDGRCYEAYAKDYVARHAQRQQSVVDAVARLRGHAAWDKATDLLRDEWVTGLEELGCAAEPELSLTDHPDGRCPKCRTSMGEFAQSAELVEAREAKADKALNDLLAGPKLPVPPPSSGQKHLTLDVRSQTDRDAALKAIAEAVGEKSVRLSITIESLES